MTAFAKKNSFPHWSIRFLVMLVTSEICPGRPAWEWINPLPQGNEIYSAAYGDNMFVVVGDLGTVMTSSNGITWILQNSGFLDTLGDVTFGNGQFVIVGDSGVILTSPDAVVWTKRNSGTGKNLFGVAWGDTGAQGGRFMAVGDSGTILTSRDAVSWVSIAAPVSSDFMTVAYGNGRFVVGGGVDTPVVQGTGDLLCLSDTVDWSFRRSTGFYLVNRLTYGDSMFVAAGKFGMILTSYDGVTWRARSTTITDDFHGVCWGNGRFFAVGPVRIFESLDGLHWYSALWGSDYFGAIAHGNHRFVIMGMDGFNRSFSDTCSDSVFMKFDDPLKGSFRSIAYGNHRIVAAGSIDQIGIQSRGTFLTFSDNAIHTVDTALMDFPISAVCFGMNIFVAVGDNGRIFSSSDGKKWTSLQSATTMTLNAISFINNQFVAAGLGGIIITSPDAKVWTIRNLLVPMRLKSVSYGNSLYVAVGENDSILVSSDAEVWSIKRLQRNVRLNSIAFGDSLFVAVGFDGAIISSYDGITWTRQNSGTTAFLSSISYSNGRFHTVGSNGVYVTSADAEIWKTEQSGTHIDLTSITYGGGRFYTVGYGGVVLASTTDSLNQKIKSVDFYHGGNQPYMRFRNRIGSIRLPDAISHRELKTDIFDIGGRRILSLVPNMENGVLYFPIAQLPADVYIASVRDKSRCLFKSTFVVTK